MSPGQLAETEYGPCHDHPFIIINKVLHNNLGGKGPDKGKEGIVYEATLKNMGDGYPPHAVEIHVHATGPYQPAWPKQNGIKGPFGQINLAHGTNVSLEIQAVDPDTNSSITLPKGGLSFFDLDTGKGNNQSVEFVRTSGLSAYYLTNDTQVMVTHNDDESTTFTATEEGTIDDNERILDKILILTALQKKRAVTLEFTNVTSIAFTIGASEGETNRIFQFALGPVLRCALTKVSAKKIAYLSSDVVAVVTQGKQSGSTGSQEGEKSGSQSLHRVAPAAMFVVMLLCVIALGTVP